MHGVKIHGMVSQWLSSSVPHEVNGGDTKRFPYRVTRMFISSELKLAIFQLHGKYCFIANKLHAHPTGMVLKMNFDTGRLKFQCPFYVFMLFFLEPGELFQIKVILSDYLSFVEFIVDRRIDGSQVVRTCDVVDYPLFQDRKGKLGVLFGCEHDDPHVGIFRSKAAHQANLIAFDGERTDDEDIEIG